MSDENVRYFDEMLKKIDMPTDTAVSEDAREIFERGRDMMLMYRGHPDTLMQALHYFMATESRPYAFAGAAQVMYAASYLSGGKYDEEGVRIALKWLTSAQEINPHRFEINLLETGFLKDKAQVRALLDRLRTHPEARTSFRYAMAEMDYWDDMNDLDKVKHWNQVAFQNAQNNTQRLYALNAMASTYMTKNMLEESLGLYHEVVKIDPNDPWAWHNMSWMYLRLKDYTNAGSCNDRALRVMDFGVARDIQKSLVNRWSQNRNPDVLKDVPPYKTRANPGK